MTVHIRFHNEPTAAQSFQLQQLAEQLRDADIVAEATSEPPQQGVRDGGLAIGIAIASLVASSISTFVSVLAYWRSTCPKYSVTVTNGNVSVSASDLSPMVAKETIRAFLAHSQSDDVTISIRDPEAE